MDIYCPRCGEPHDTYELRHAYDHLDHRRSSDEARNLFFTKGCAVALDSYNNPCRSRVQASSGPE